MRDNFKLRSLAMLLVMPCLFVVGYAQDVEEDPIEEALVECLDESEDQSTAGMSACLRTAYDAYDADLNEVYRSLMASLDATGQEALRTAQRAWIGLRDAEFTFIDRGPYPEDGTMYVLFRLDDRIDFVRERGQRLRGYLSALTEFEEER